MIQEVGKPFMVSITLFHNWEACNIKGSLVGGKGPKNLSEKIVRKCRKIEAKLT